MLYRVIFAVSWLIALGASKGITQVETGKIYSFAQNDKLFTKHVIEAGQTLYSIARLYHCKSEDLELTNDGIDIYSLRISDTLIIPIPVEYLQSAPSEESRSSEVYYVVQPKDNLFRLARIVLGWREEQLMILNGMQSADIQIGQSLFLGYLTGEKIRTILTVENIDSEESQPVDPENQKVDYKQKFTSVERVKTFLNQQGVAIWFDDTDINTGLFIMHHNAPVNSIIAINNPMFNKTVHAKVVGNIPENAYPKDIIAVVSPQVARELGVLDKRFFAKLRYESYLP